LDLATARIARGRATRDRGTQRRINKGKGRERGPRDRLMEVERKVEEADVGDRNDKGGGDEQP